MAAVVNLADELLAGVLHAAEHLKGRVIAAEAGALESLRWAGALPLLLRDLGVIKIIDADRLWECKTSDQLRALVSSSAVATEDVEQQAVELLVVLTDFLWECEPRLIRMLQLGGGIQRLTICSSLSERAHECYDFGPGRPTLQMRFDQFAAKLSVYFQPPSLSNSSGSKAPAAPSLPAPIVAPAATEDDEDEEWGWTDDFPDQPTAAVRETSPSKPSAQLAPTPHASISSTESSSVQVIHLPLGFAPLLSAKQRTTEPSVFVLCHPVCAAAFPLLLDRVVNADRPKENIFLAGPQTSTAATEAAIRAYTHVKEVVPEHIPGAFRRSLKLLSHTLGEMLVHMRLDVKERLFAMGATSLKVGHTLVRSTRAEMIVGDVSQLIISAYKYFPVADCKRASRGDDAVSASRSSTCNCRPDR